MNADSLRTQLAALPPEQHAEYLKVCVLRVASAHVLLRPPSERDEAIAHADAAIDEVLRLARGEVA